MRVAMPLVSVIMLAECVDVSIAAGHLVGVSIGDVFGMNVLDEFATVLGMDGAVHGCLVVSIVQITHRRMPTRIPTRNQATSLMAWHPAIAPEGGRRVERRRNGERNVASRRPASDRTGTHHR